LADSHNDAIPLDVLDQFTTPPPPPRHPPQQQQQQQPASTSMLEEDEFMRELAKGMESLMRELAEEGPVAGVASSSGEKGEQQQQQQQHGEEASPAEFQKKIREAVGKLKESDVGLDVSMLSFLNGLFFI
jgi:hypothetical protein